MSSNDGYREKALALCDACETALTVWILRDGSITPIGTGDTCSCGSETYRVLDRDDLVVGGTSTENVSD